ESEVRLLAAVLLLALPILHASLHLSAAQGCNFQQGGPALSARGSAASADHDIDCPICAFRLSESAVFEPSIPLAAHEADRSPASFCWGDRSPQPNRLLPPRRRPRPSRPPWSCCGKSVYFANKCRSNRNITRRK